MQGIIISIRGKWWDLIKSGEKPLELRKTAPKSLLAGKSRVEIRETGVLWIPEKPFLCLVYVPEKKAVCGRFFCPGVEVFQERKTLAEYGLKRPPQSWQYSVSVDGDK